MTTQPVFLFEHANLSTINLYLLQPNLVSNRIYTVRNFTTLETNVEKTTEPVFFLEMTSK